MYGDLAAVQDLSFRVLPGEVVGLVGPNGAGKTTTLHCLAGITVPTRGRIRVAGHDLAADPVAAKSALAFVPDEPHLFEYLTVEEHLRFVARLYRVADVERRVPGVLREMELEDRRGALPEELSRGMKQKLAIACALIHEPKALLLDEPLTGLDPVGIRRMKATILDHARAGAAVILSSHLLHLVEEICTRVLIMRRGRVLAFGTIAEIVAARPDLAGLKLEDVFLGLVGQDGPDEDVTGPLGYLAARSTRNRLARQLRRLRTPRYAVALAAGPGLPLGDRCQTAAWLRAAGREPRDGRASRGGRRDGSFSLWTWIFGADRRALAFSRAEVTWLFPAPVTRRAAHPIQAAPRPGRHPVQRSPVDLSAVAGAGPVPGHGGARAPSGSCSPPWPCTAWASRCSGAAWWSTAPWRSGPARSR